MSGIPQFKTNPCDSNKINSPFGGRTDPNNGGYDKHDGIDIGPLVAGVPGDKIYAVLGGTVKRADLSQSGWGNVVVIEHNKFLSGRFCTLYAHLSQIDVVEGQTVYAGQRIGLMGGKKYAFGSGNSTGVHLHFELRDVEYAGFYTTKNIINPAPYMKLTKDGAKTTENITDEQLEKGMEDYNFPYTSYGVDRQSQKLYDKQYGRRYKIIVTDDQGINYDVSDLHCIFNIKKAWIEAMSQMSYIKIYNLEPNTESNIILHGTTITVEAGYEGSLYGTIFVGNIVQTIRSKENGTDYLLEIIAVDSERFLSSEWANRSFTRGQTMRDIITQITEKSATNPITIATIGQEYSKKAYKRGKVMYGKSSDYIEQLARSQNTYPQYDNNTLSLTPITDVPQGEIIRLDYNSGMVGAPTQTEYGIDVKSLLNPQLKVNSLIQVEKQNIVERQISLGAVQYIDIDQDGVYRIIEIVYSGDTRGQDWYCELTTINQAGVFPSILVGGGYSI